MTLSTWNGGILVSDQFGALNSWKPTSAPISIGVNNTYVKYGQVVSSAGGDIVTVVTDAPQGMCVGDCVMCVVWKLLNARLNTYMFV